MITIRDAALLYDASERTILYWAKKQYNCYQGW